MTKFKRKKSKTRVGPKEKERIKARNVASRGRIADQQSTQVVGSMNDLDPGDIQIDESPQELQLNVNHEGPETETDRGIFKKYEDLDDKVKNARQKDNTDYFAVRCAMGLPEPDMLMWNQSYVPVGPSNNDPRFTLQRPTDRKTNKALVEGDEPKFVFHVGKTISLDHALRLKLFHSEMGFGDGPGRPSKYKKFVDYRNKNRNGIRRQILAATGGRQPREATASLVPVDPIVGAASGTESGTSAQTPRGPTAKSGPSQVPHGSTGSGSNEVAVAFGPVSDKYPLASWLVKRVSADAAALTEIGEVAVALVLSARGQEVEKQTLDLLIKKTDQPREFATHIKDQLVNLLSSIRPDMLHRIEILEGALAQWYEYGEGIENYYGRRINHLQHLLQSAEKRADIAVRIMPAQLQAEYSKIMMFADDYPDIAEGAIMRVKNLPELPATAGQQPNSGNGPQPFDQRVEGLEKLRASMLKLRAQGGLQNIDPDVVALLDQHVVTEGFKRKYADYLRDYLRTNKEAANDGGQSK